MKWVDGSAFHSFSKCANMPKMKAEPENWDFFIAYPSSKRAAAETLYKHLSASARVFWDGLLTMGVKWPIELEKNQRLARYTVVLVDDEPSESHTYYLDEIARAISLNQTTSGNHKVVPLLLQSTISNVPYGLSPFQSLQTGTDGELSRVAELLLEDLRRPGRTSWKDYDGLFDLDGYQVAYLPLLNGSCTEIQQFGIAQVKIIREMGAYHLPDAFRNTSVGLGFSNDASCRLASYDFPSKGELRLTFSETSYENYLKSGEHLDDPILRGEARTFRDEFGSLVRDGHHSLRPFQLTNISGVGVVLMTKDHHVIVSRHSRRSHVYPGRWTFSASGVMKWGAYPHPFQEAVRKCYEELRHQANIEAMRLIGFGADARKLYFQFMFVENTEENSTDVVRRSRMEPQVLSVPLEPDEVVRQLLDKCWEPAAEVALLTLSAQVFGRDRVIAELKSAESQWGRRQMIDEWDLRAGQAGLLPVMSVRYPEARREQISTAYVDAVMEFIGDEVDNKRVLEVGCGIGRITRRLSEKAKYVAAIDLSELMLEKAKEQIGDQAAPKKVRFTRCFAQDYQTARRFDIAICSLVLIHNVADVDFAALVSMVCRSSNTIFVFEDITEGRATSPHTRLRSRIDLEHEFLRNDFSLGKNERYDVFDDTLAFLKFVRGSSRHKSAHY